MQLITKKTLILNVADMKYNTTSANDDPYQYNLKLKHGRVSIKSSTDDGKWTKSIEDASHQKTFFFLLSPK